MKKPVLLKTWWGVVIFFFLAELILLRKTFFFHDEWTFIHQILLSPTAFIFSPHNGHFWPLFAGIYLLLYKLFNLNYWPYEIVLLIFHFANVYLLYLIISLLSKNKFVAFCFSLLFLISSIYWEVLFSASTLPTVLCLFFMNLGIYLFLIFEKRNQNRYLYLSGISILASGFSWGAGLFSPGIFILLLIIKSIAEKKIRLKELFVYILTMKTISVSLWMKKKNSNSPEAQASGYRGHKPMVVYFIDQVILFLVYIYFSRGVAGAYDFRKIILFTASGIKWLIVSFYTSSPGFAKIFVGIILFFGFLLYLSLRTKKNRRIFRDGLVTNIPWLIFALSGVFYFYFISALSRSQIDMRLAFSSRYTYLPLYFLILFNALIIDCWLSMASLKTKKILLVYFLAVSFANIYFFRIYYQSWTETISIPNQKLFWQIANTASEKERAKIIVPSTFHDFYEPEDIYFIFSRSKENVSER